MHLFPEYDGVLSHKICLGYKSLLKVVLTSCLVSKQLCKSLVFKYAFGFAMRLLCFFNFFISIPSSSQYSFTSIYLLVKWECTFSLNMMGFYRTKFV